MSDAQFSIIVQNTQTLFTNLGTIINYIRNWMIAAARLVVSTPILSVSFGFLFLGVSIAVFGALCRR